MSDSGDGASAGAGAAAAAASPAAHDSAASGDGSEAQTPVQAPATPQQTPKTPGSVVAPVWDDVPEPQADAEGTPSLALSAALSLLSSFGVELVAQLNARFAEGEDAKARSKREIEIVLDTTAWGQYPRLEAFYVRTVRALEALASHSLQAVVDVCLGLMPSESITYRLMTAADKQSLAAASAAAAEALVVPGSFDSLQAMITVPSMNGATGYARWQQAPKQWDLVRVVLDLFCTDVLANALRHYDGANLRPSTARKLVELAFSGVRASRPLRLLPEVWDSLRDDVVEQWSAVIARLTPHRIAHVLHSCERAMSPALKPSTEDLLRVLRVVRHVRVDASNGAATLPVLDMLSALNASLKKTPHRVAYAELFARVVQQIDFASAANSDQPPADALLPKVVELLGVAERLIKTAETFGWGLRAATFIVVRLPGAEFQLRGDAHLRRILKGVFAERTKSESLVALLDFLRGAFVPTEFGWSPSARVANDAAAATGPAAAAADRAASAGAGYEAQSESASVLSPLGGARMPSEAADAKAYAFVTRNDEPTHVATQRLEMISDELFGRKQLPRIASSMAELVAIVVQMASHSLHFLSTRIVATLFNERQSVEVSMVGVRAMYVILNPESGFQAHASNAVHNRKTQVGEVLADLTAKMSEQLGRLLTMCTDAVGIRVFGQATDWLHFSSYRSLSAIEKEEQVIEELQDARLKGLAQRWLEVSRTRRRQQQLEDQVDPSTDPYQEKLLKVFGEWSQQSGVAMSALYDADAVSELVAMRRRRLLRRANSRLTDRKGMLELYKDLLKLVPHAFDRETLPFETVTDALIHPDLELATCASHSLQQIVDAGPELRHFLVSSLLKMLYSSTLDQASLRTVLAHLVGLLDLWHRQVAVEAIADLHTGEDLAHLQEWAVQAEALAVVTLCRPDPDTRKHALRLVRVVAELEEAYRELDDSDTPVERRPRLQSVLTASSVEIVQRARAFAIRDAMHGVDDISLRIDSTMLTFEELMRSNSRVATFALAELAYFAIDAGCLEMLQELRNRSTEVLSNLQIPMHLKAVQSEEGVRSFSVEFREHLLNTLVLLFSASGMPSWLPDPSAADSDASTTDPVPVYADRTNVHQALLSVANGLWEYLVSEVHWVSDSIVTAVGLVHPSSASHLLDSLALWEKQPAGSKRLNARKSAARVAVVTAFRRISQSRLFATHSLTRPETLALFLAFMSDSDDALFAPSAHPSLETLPQYLDHILMVQSVAEALYTPRPTTNVGSLCVRYTESKFSDVFKRHTRTTWLRHLLTLAPNHPASAENLTVLRNEVTKELSRIRDEKEHNARQEALQRLMRDVESAVRRSIEGIVKLGPVFDESEHASPEFVATVEWVIANEREGHPLFAPFLALNFSPELLNQVVQRVFSTNRSDAVRCFEGLCDVFVNNESLVPQLPRTGIAADRSAYYRKLATLATQEIMPITQLTDADNRFARQVELVGPRVVFTALFHLADPEPGVRTRAFELVSRLEAFFSRRDSPSTDLLQYKNAFQSEIIATAKMNAVYVSSHIARACQPLVAGVFSEAFHLARTSPSLSTGLWMAQFLLPWCDYLSLDANVALPADSAHVKLDAAAANQFIANLLTFSAPLMTDEVPQEAVLMWQRLAVAVKTGDEVPNLSAMLEFLLIESVRHAQLLPMYKKHVLSLFRVEPHLTVAFLVGTLSFTGLERVLARKRAYQDATDKFRSEHAAWRAAIEATPASATSPSTPTADATPSSPAATAKPAAIPPEPKMPELHYHPEMLDSWIPASFLVQDLISDSLRPFVPHLATVLHFCFMNFNYVPLNGAPQKILSLLFNNLPLINPSAAASLLSTASVVAQFVRAPGATLDWKTVEEGLDGAAIFDILKSGAGSADSEALDGTPAAKKDEPWASFMPDANGALLPVKIVALLRAMLPDQVAELWGIESLRWLRSSDMTLTFKAIQIYLGLCFPLNRSIVHYLISSLHKVLFDGQSVLSKNIIGSRGTLSWANSQLSSVLAASSRVTSGLASTQATHILAALDVIARMYAAKGELYTFPNIAMSAVAGLRCTHAQFRSIYRTALQLMHALLYRTPLFNRLLPQSKMAAAAFDPSALLQFVDDWTPAYEGLQPLLYLGLRRPLSFHIAAACMCQLFRFEDHPFVYKGTGRIYTAILSLLPWLACEVTEGKHVDGAHGVYMKVADVAREISSACARSTDGLEQAAGVFEQLGAGAYRGNGMALIQDALDALNEVYLPHAAGPALALLLPMLQQGIVRHQPYVVAIVSTMLESPRAVQFADAVVPVVAAALERLSLPSQLDVSLRMLAQVSRVSSARGDAQTWFASSEPLFTEPLAEATSLRPSISSLMSTMRLSEQRFKPFTLDQLEAEIAKQPLRVALPKTASAPPMASWGAADAAPSPTPLPPVRRAAPATVSVDLVAEQQQQQQQQQQSQAPKRLPSAQALAAQPVQAQHAQPQAQHQPAQRQQQQTAPPQRVTPAVVRAPADEYDSDRSDEGETFVSAKKEPSTPSHVLGAGTPTRRAPVAPVRATAPVGAAPSSTRAAVVVGATPAPAAAATPTRAAPSEPLSLSRVLHDVKLRPYLTKFIENNFDTDELNFYNAVRDYTQETSVARAALKARVIVERFISIDSFDTINIEDATRSDILRAYEASLPGAPPITLFQRAAEEVKGAMARDIFPAFLESQECREMRAAHRV